MRLHLRIQVGRHPVYALLDFGDILVDESAQHLILLPLLRQQFL